MRTIGKWVIGETLGEGGFSKVKLGIDPDTGEKAALKILPKNRWALQDTAMRQVQAEIRAMSKIQHENVIRLFDVSFDAKYPKSDGSLVDVLLVVLEFAAGGEFFDFLSYTGKYPEAIARDFFKQMISGLEACHMHGIAHRDIKPENLLLDAQFVLKLADFGFSRVLADENDTMATECGTRGYMAPEILEHHRYTMKTDIFAAGVVLFIMLAGFPPFQIARRNDWWFHKLIVGRQHLFWQAHCRTAQFSDTAKDLIERLLSPDPNKRITLDEIKEHEWWREESDMTRDDILSNLEERKQKVEERKDQEKRQSMVAQNAASGDSVQTYRSLGMGYDDEEVQADADALPSAIPNLQAFVGKGVAAPAPASNSSNASQLDASSPSAPTEPPQIFNQAEHAQVYTQFLSNAPANEIVRRIIKHARSMKAQDIVIKEKSYKIKATHKFEFEDSGPIQFVAKIYRHPEHDGLFQVIFSRRHGDIFAYQRLFAIYQDKLADLRVSAPAKAASKDEPEAEAESAPAQAPPEAADESDDDGDDELPS